MKHEVFDIWEAEKPWIPGWPWQAQLIGYVGNFPTREAAERFVADVKAYREKHGLK